MESTEHPVSGLPVPLKPAITSPGSRRRLAVRIAVIAAATAVVCLAAAHLMLVLYLRSHVPGYVKVGFNSIDMLERTLVQPASGQEVVLIGMAHLGDREFYSQVEDRLSGDGLILCEGVTDELELLGEGGTASPYGSLGAMLGLTAQQAFNQPRERLVWADVDVTELRAESVRILRLLFATLSPSAGPAARRTSLAALAEIELESPGMEERLLNDIIETRNRHLLKVAAQHSDAPRLYIPWGAWHMPGLETELLAQGYERQGETSRRVTTLGRIYWNLLCTLVRGQNSE